VTQNDTSDICDMDGVMDVIDLNPVETVETAGEARRPGSHRVGPS
jgi:hypothetical protein